MTTRALAMAGAAVLAASAAAWAQMATADRIQGPGFWPTQPSPARKDFLGPAACARCHVSHAQSQAGTSMAQTAMKAADAPTLRDNPTLRIRSGTYTYEITDQRRPERSTASPGPTGSSSSAPARLGLRRGQGRPDVPVREGRRPPGGRGSATSPATAPTSRPRARSRRPRTSRKRWRGRFPTRRRAAASPATTRRPPRPVAFDTNGLIPGVTCEACHGPGRQHVEAIEQKKLGPALDAIMNPARLDPGRFRRFLRGLPRDVLGREARGRGGHRRPALAAEPAPVQQVLGRGRRAHHLRGLPRSARAAGPRGRRLRLALPELSRAGGGFRRGARGPTKDHPGRACPVARSSCVTCHMPKYEAPGMHHEFTDHHIRIVAAPR